MSTFIANIIVSKYFKGFTKRPSNGKATVESPVVTYFLYRLYLDKLR